MDRRRYLAISIGCLLASASFEDALAALERVGGQADANRADEYRALCFLGLDRTRDAERAIERLVMRGRTPTYDLARFPLQFVALYRTVRKRTLPIAATALYDSAKAHFEDGQFVMPRRSSGSFSFCCRTPKRRRCAT